MYVTTMGGFVSSHACLTLYLGFSLILSSLATPKLYLLTCTPFIHWGFFACFVCVLAFLLTFVSSGTPCVIPSFYGCVAYFPSLRPSSPFTFTHPVLPCTVSAKHSCVHKLRLSLPAYCLFLSIELEVSRDKYMVVIVPANRAWAVVPAGFNCSWLPQRWVQPRWM